VFQRFVLFGVVVSIISSVVGVSYTYCSYHFLFDFSKTLPIWKIVITYVFLGLLFSGLYFVVNEFFTTYLIFLNIAVVLISFLSIIWPIIVNIDEEFPEMFPSFAIPLHFIFPLFWLALFPHFFKRTHD